MDVAVGFISPESGAVCKHLLEEYRSFPHHVLKKTIYCSQHRSAGDQLGISLTKQNTEMVKSFVEKEGHSLSPDTRATLWNGILGLLSKISFRLDETPYQLLTGSFYFIFNF